MTAETVKKRRLPLLGRETTLAVAVPAGSTPADTFADVIHRFEKAGLLDRAAPRGRANLTVHARDNESLWQAVTRRYHELGIACPFLVRGHCSVYEDRPLVCREFYVSTPAEYCTSRHADVRALPRPVRMSEVLADTENALSGGEQLLIPLVLAMEWAEEHADVLDPSLGGEHVVEVLLDCIEVLA